MHHVAIMNSQWKLIPKILSGEKSIESRWYKTRRAPWNGIKKGDTVFFKDAGKPVTAKASVLKVMQFEFSVGTGIADARSIIKKYGKGICLVNKDPATWVRVPRYCILIFLKNPVTIKTPFFIRKKGFGSAAAWLSVRHINDIMAA